MDKRATEKHAISSARKSKKKLTKHKSSAKTSKFSESNLRNVTSTEKESNAASKKKSNLSEKLARALKKETGRRKKEKESEKKINELEFYRDISLVNMQYYDKQQKYPFQTKLELMETKKSSNNEEQLKDLPSLLKILDELLENHDNGKAVAAARYLPHGLGSGVITDEDFINTNNQQQLFATSLRRCQVRAEDSMYSLLEYNNNAQSQLQNKHHTTFNIVLILAKPLLRNRITVEYASRIRALIQLLHDHGEDDGFSYRPNLISFASSHYSNTTSQNPEAMLAGYKLFVNLASIYNISLNGIEFHMNSTLPSSHTSTSSFTEHYAIDSLLHDLKATYLPKWLTSRKYSNQNNQVKIHFTLISSEYNLCNINDIHRRSPRHSFMTPILNLEEQSLSILDNQTMFQDISSALQNKDDKKKGLLQFSFKNSWTFYYSSYPYYFFTTNNKKNTHTLAFLGKCYVLGEKLLPLLINLRGVVDSTEFFQRDNFFVLTSIRRSLVTHLEQLYRYPTKFCDELNYYVTLSREIRNDQASSIDDNIDVKSSLESALLSLGRCADVVRPAGLFIRPVEKKSWEKALKDLEFCMQELNRICDPDRPLTMSSWISLLQQDIADIT